MVDAAHHPLTLVLRVPQRLERGGWLRHAVLVVGDAPGGEVAERGVAVLVAQEVVHRVGVGNVPVEVDLLEDSLGLTDLPAALVCDSDVHAGPRLLGDGAVQQRGAVAEQGHDLDVVLPLERAVDRLVHHLVFLAAIRPQHQRHRLGPGDPRHGQRCGRGGAQQHAARCGQGGSGCCHVALVAWSGRMQRLRHSAATAAPLGCNGCATRLQRLRHSAAMASRRGRNGCATRLQWLPARRPCLHHDRRSTHAGPARIATGFRRDYGRARDQRPIHAPVSGG